MEAIASGTAHRARRPALWSTSGADAGDTAGAARGDGAEVDAELVARAADGGRRRACRPSSNARGSRSARLCASLVNLLDPEMIVIGGSIAEHHPRLFEVARAELPRFAFPILADRVRIEPAALGGDVSLIGGLPIVNDRIGDPAFAGSQRSRRRPAARSTSS